MAVLLTVVSVVVNAATDAPARPPAGLRYVVAGDVRTRIRVWGDAGPPIVLVHGGAESADTWAPVAERLATAHHHVYALDLDGWGYSQRIAPYDLDHQTRQLLALIDVLGLQKPVLVGHSSGAASVVEAAVRAPDQVGGVVLLDGDALPTGAPPAAVRRLLLPPWRTTALRLGLTSDALIRGLYDAQCGPRCPALDAAGVDAWRRPLRVAGAEDGLWGLLRTGIPGVQPARLAELAGLPMPKAVVFGAEDDVFPAGTAELTAARIGAPPPVIIPRGRHLTLISDPDTVAGAVLALAARSLR